MQGLNDERSVQAYSDVYDRGWGYVRGMPLEPLLENPYLRFDWRELYKPAVFHPTYNQYEATNLMLRAL